MVTDGLKAKGHVLRFEQDPGEGLINAQQTSGPSPPEIGTGKAAKVGVVEKVLAIVPTGHEVVAQNRQKRQSRGQAHNGG